jgi:hypothetical protein
MNWFWEEKTFHGGWNGCLAKTRPETTKQGGKLRIKVPESIGRELRREPVAVSSDLTLDQVIESQGFQNDPTI